MLVDTNTVPDPARLGWVLTVSSPFSDPVRRFCGIVLSQQASAAQCCIGVSYTRRAALPGRLQQLSAGATLTRAKSALSAHEAKPPTAGKACLS